MRGFDGSGSRNLAETEVSPMSIVDKGLVRGRTANLELSLAAWRSMVAFCLQRMDARANGSTQRCRYESSSRTCCCSFAIELRVRRYWHTTLDARWLVKCDPPARTSPRGLPHLWHGSAAIQEREARPDRAKMGPARRQRKPPTDPPDPSDLNISRRRGMLYGTAL